MLAYCVVLLFCSFVPDAGMVTCVLKWANNAFFSISNYRLAMPVNALAFTSGPHTTRNALPCPRWRARDNFCYFYLGTPCTTNLLCSFAAKLERVRMKNVEKGVLVRYICLGLFNNG